MIEALILLIVLLVVVIWIYSLLIKDRNQVLAAWSDIDVQLKRRHDLIPQLVTAVKIWAEQFTEIFAKLEEKPDRTTIRCGTPVFFTVTISAHSRQRLIAALIVPSLQQLPHPAQHLEVVNSPEAAGGHKYVHTNSQARKTMPGWEVPQGNLSIIFGLGSSGRCPVPARL